MRWPVTAGIETTTVGHIAEQLVAATVPFWPYLSPDAVIMIPWLAPNSEAVDSVSSDIQR